MRPGRSIGAAIIVATLASVVTFWALPSGGLPAVRAKSSDEVAWAAQVRAELATNPGPGKCTHPVPSARVLVGYGRVTSVCAYVNTSMHEYSVEFSGAKGGIVYTSGWYPPPYDSCYRPLGHGWLRIVGTEADGSCPSWSQFEPGP